MSAWVKRIAPILVVTVVAVLPAFAAGGTLVTKKVTVGDDYYGPTTLIVKKNTAIKWSWVTENTNSHDVKLSSGPKGVSTFHSPSAASDFSYTKKLTVPGTYKIICTLHQDMKMTIQVKK